MQTAFRSRYTRGIRGRMTFAHTRCSVIGAVSPTVMTIPSNAGRKTSVNPATDSGRQGESQDYLRTAQSLRGPTAGLTVRAPERPFQERVLRIVGGALHGPIARSPGILGRDQPVVVEFGIVVRLADIGPNAGSQ